MAVAIPLDSGAGLSWLAATVGLPGMRGEGDCAQDAGRMYAELV